VSPRDRLAARDGSGGDPARPPLSSGVRRDTPAQSPELVVVPGPDAVAAFAAARVVRRCATAVAERGECALALAGGDTPRGLYALLAAEPFRTEIPWGRLRVFWGDERGVPPTDPRSNYRMVNEALLSRVPIPPDRVHRMPAQRPDGASAAEAAAEEYAALLRAHLPASADGVPRLDLALLGLGSDAHTASLFPSAAALRETRRLVVSYEVPDLGMSRMTLTLPMLNHAGEVLFLVAGAPKARALAAVLEGPSDPERVPAQGIRPVSGRVVWIVDAAAASQLRRPPDRS
jgi:6-phosphogluconolactonase